MKNGLKLKMNRLTILQEIFYNFQQMSQWIILESYSKYYHRAEQLIELLEVEDCGSVGGFDEKNPTINKTGFRLYDRFLTLLKKKRDASKLEPICGFTPKSLGDYFKEVQTLRYKKLDNYKNHV